MNVRHSISPVLGQKLVCPSESYIYSTVELSGRQRIPATTTGSTDVVVNPTQTHSDCTQKPDVRVLKQSKTGQSHL